MMELPIAVFVVLIVFTLSGLVFAGVIFFGIAEGELVPRERIYHHQDNCYTHYYRKLNQHERRIRYLENVLRRVPVELRSRRVKKIVGESR